MLYLFFFKGTSLFIEDVWHLVAMLLWFILPG